MSGTDRIFGVSWMAVRVFFHIGVPKSGTTFLQTTLWRHAAQLRREGVLLPGEGHRDHRWASLVVREDPKLANRAPEAREAWDRIVRDVHAWPGTAVISHEFFATASKRQADRAVAALAPAEVHLVVTARDPLGLLTASWQETLKFRGVQPLDDFNRHVSSSPHDIWNWRGLDAAEVLERWAAHVPADRLHIVPMPPLGRDRRLLWDRFAGLFSVDPRQYDVSGSSCNRSLGLVQCELLRQLSPSLGRFPTALARSRWIRGYLAEEKLGAHSHERFLPGPVRVQECRERGRRMVRRLREGGFHQRRRGGAPGPGHPSEPANPRRRDLGGAAGGHGRPRRGIAGRRPGDASTSGRGGSSGPRCPSAAGSAPQWRRDGVPRRTPAAGAAGLSSRRRHADGLRQRLRILARQPRCSAPERRGDGRELGRRHHPSGLPFLDHSAPCVRGTTTYALRAACRAEMLPTSTRSGESSPRQRVAATRIQCLVSAPHLADTRTGPGSPGPGGRRLSTTGGPARRANCWRRGVPARGVQRR